jgi:hypothetical protein
MLFVKVKGCKYFGTEGVSILQNEYATAPSYFRMDKSNIFVEKKEQRRCENRATMSAGEGPSSGRPRAPGIEENRNVKRCRN